MKKDQILAALPALKQADLAAIKAATGALLDQGQPQQLKGGDTPLTWLADAIMMVAGGPVYRPQQNKSIQVPLNKNGSVVVSFMEISFPEIMKNKIKAQGLMQYLLSLLADDLKRIKVPVTPLTMASNLGRLPVVFDREFPGYTESGIANLVLAKITANK